jgi:MFS family permease
MAHSNNGRAPAVQRGDIVRLFAARSARLFAYGFLSVILVLYLAAAGLTQPQIGLLLSLTLAGDAVFSLAITATADRIGRQRMLLLGAALMIFAGLAFLLTRNPLLLMLAAIIGVISPSGNEIGPFLAIEQASLSQLVPDEQRTRLFAWYHLAGSFSTALGALASGGLAQLLQANGLAPLDAYRVVLTGYALAGGLLLVFFLGLSPAVEAARPADLPASTASASRTHPLASLIGLHRSRRIVLQLSTLFAMDAFAGGFIVQSIISYWFFTRYGISEAGLGTIFFGANLLAGISALLAARLAARFGLLNTMVWSHIPSNVLLILVPLMPSAPLAIGVLWLRFSISQMDVPARQSYTVALVDRDERSAASGVTNIARSIGASLSPALSGLLLSNPALFSAPFFLAGGIKISYDLLIYQRFHTIHPPEERERKR